MVRMADSPIPFVEGRVSSKNRREQAAGTGTGQTGEGGWGGGRRKEQVERKKEGKKNKYSFFEKNDCRFSNAIIYAQADFNRGLSSGPSRSLPGDPNLRCGSPKFIKRSFPRSSHSRYDKNTLVMLLRGPRRVATAKSCSSGPDKTQDLHMMLVTSLHLR